MIGILKVALAEFRKIFKDVGVMLILIGAPLFYSFFYPFPYMDEIVRKVPTAVVDEDKSDLSKKITRMLNSTEEMSVTTEYASIDEAKEAFMMREINAIIHIPRGFYKNILLGNQPPVTLFADGSYMIFYSETLASSMKVILTTAAGVKIQRMTMSGIPSKDALNLQSSANTISNALYNPKGGYASYVVPAVLTLILQQILLVAIFMRQGTDYERGYDFPESVNAVQILFGKLIVYSIFFAAMAFYFYGVSMKIFSLPDFAKIFDLMMFLIPYGLSIIFLGIASGYFAREREGAVLFMIMTSIPLLFLSGFAWPIFVMPEWVQALRVIFPSSAGIDGVVMVRQMGASLHNVQTAYLNLWVLTLIYMVLALFTINWQMRREKSRKS